MLSKYKFQIFILCSNYYH